MIRMKIYVRKKKFSHGDLIENKRRENRGMSCRGEGRVCPVLGRFVMLLNEYAFVAGPVDTGHFLLLCPL